MRGIPWITPSIVTTIRRLALEAGAAIMTVYGSDDFAVRAKSDASPVTEADERADAIIARGLAAAFPDIPAVTEEQAASHGLDGAPVFFLVDPLDGTKEFVQRRGDFTVNIALIENGVPTRGVVYAPGQGAAVLHRRRRPARRRRPGPSRPSTIGALTPLTVADPRPRRRSSSSPPSRTATRRPTTISPATRVEDFRSAGSSLKFCLVAAGEADLYPRLGRTMEWDTAAGQAVLLGAGGEVVRFDDHTPLAYGKKGFENPFFIAHAPGVALVAG